MVAFQKSRVDTQYSTYSPPDCGYPANVPCRSETDRKPPQSHRRLYSAEKPQFQSINLANRRRLTADFTLRSSRSSSPRCPNKPTTAGSLLCTHRTVLTGYRPLCPPQTRTQRMPRRFLRIIKDSQQSHGQIHCGLNADSSSSIQQVSRAASLALEQHVCAHLPVSLATRNHQSH